MLHCPSALPPAAAGVVFMHGVPQHRVFHLIAKMPPSGPYTVRLDADSARELARRGGAILLLDVPEGAAVGVDQQVSCSNSTSHSRTVR